MIFKAVAIDDIVFESYEARRDGTVRIMKKKIEYRIPAGTIVDVWGVYSGNSADSTIIGPRFIVYHDSLPHFFATGISEFRPL